MRYFHITYSRGNISDSFLYSLTKFIPEKITAE